VAGDEGFVYAARNRARIAMLILLAVVNYWLATVVAAVVIALTLALRVLAEGGDVPTDTKVLKVIGIGLFIVTAIAVVVGSLVALFRLPFLRLGLERRVLRETGARIASPDDHPQVRNLLEGLAIASGLPAPRFAVIDDDAPNSFGVGTRAKKAVVAVTTGLIDALTRDELEAILAYEVSRIGDWDVALSSWTVALTGNAISAVDEDDGGLMALFGFLPRIGAQRLQGWVVTGQARQRDRAAIHFTRHPVALVRALEKLDADTQQVGRVTRATAPLWIEVPTQALGTSRYGRRIARELGLTERVATLRELAGLPAS
jgi:heat shock protein HtpX